MNKKTFIIIIVVLVSSSYFAAGLKNEQQVEEMEVVVGFGANLGKNKSSEIMYIAPSSVYTFEEGERLSSDLKVGKGATPAKTREDRQLLSNKRYILGLERVYLLGEEIAGVGIKNSIEIFFRNSYTNDNGYIAICHGNPEEIFEFKVKGYPSSADYIQGMLKNAKYYNFYSSHYKISDIFLNLDAEGRNINLPYIDIEEGKLKITGLCIFNKDKMIAKLNKDEAKLLNMLNDTDGMGLITFRKSPNEYLDFYGKVKRKVKAYKINNKYKYSVELNFKGDIISDTIYSNDINNAYVNNKIQAELAKAVKDSCQSFIAKGKNQYKVDFLQLGQYAAAKYGRGKGVDWDEVFTEADIEVKVKFQIDRKGRGNYLYKGE